MKIWIVRSWILMPCGPSLVGSYRRFGGTYRLHGNCGLFGCDAVYSYILLPVFRRNVSRPFSGFKI
jgi:hypothetical protein